MKSSSVPVEGLPVVTTTGLNASAPIDVGNGYGGFTVQFEDVTAATSVAYVLEGSLDGETWFDITNCLRNLGSGNAAIAAPITVDSICDYPVRFPGSVRVVCTHAPDSVPSTLPSVVVAFQDSRQA